MYASLLLYLQTGLLAQHCVLPLLLSLALALALLQQLPNRLNTNMLLLLLQSNAVAAADVLWYQPHQLLVTVATPGLTKTCFSCCCSALPSTLPPQPFDQGLTKV